VQLGFLLLTDQAESVNGKVYVLGGGWNVLRFTELPHRWSFRIALGVDVPWDQTNQRHSLEVTIEDPDGGIIGEAFEAEFESGRPPGSMPGQDQRMVMSILTTPTFETTGPHAAVVRSDDEELGRARFYVTRAEGMPEE
jgi:uncharacterized protein DUF6941